MSTSISLAALLLSAASEFELKRSWSLSPSDAITSLATTAKAEDVVAFGTRAGRVCIVKNGTIRVLKRRSLATESGRVYETNVETVCFADGSSEHLASSTIGWATLWNAICEAEIGSIMLPEMKAYPTFYGHRGPEEYSFIVGGRNSAKPTSRPSMFQISVSEWKEIADLQLGAGETSKDNATARLCELSFSDSGSITSLAADNSATFLAVAGTAFVDRSSVQKRHEFLVKARHPKSIDSGEVPRFGGESKLEGSRSFLCIWNVADKRLLLQNWFPQNERCIGAIFVNRRELLAFVIVDGQNLSVKCIRFSCSSAFGQLNKWKLWERHIDRGDRVVVARGNLSVASKHAVWLLDPEDGRARFKIVPDKEFTDITSHAFDERGIVLWLGNDRGSLARYERKR